MRVSLRRVSHCLHSKSVWVLAMLLPLSEGLGTVLGQPLGKDTVFVFIAIDKVLRGAELFVARQWIKGHCSHVAHPRGEPERACALLVCCALGPQQELLAQTFVLERQLNVKAKHLWTNYRWNRAQTADLYVNEADDVATVFDQSNVYSG
jgi:hypothetical protein